MVALNTVQVFLISPTSFAVFSCVAMSLCVVVSSSSCMLTLTYSYRELCLITGVDICPYCTILVLSFNLEVGILLT